MRTFQLYHQKKSLNVSSTETVRLQDPRMYKALHRSKLAQKAREDGARPRGARHQEATWRPPAEAPRAQGQQRE